MTGYEKLNAGDGVIVSGHDHHVFTVVYATDEKVWLEKAGYADFIRPRGDVEKINMTAFEAGRWYNYYGGYDIRSSGIFYQCLGVDDEGRAAGLSWRKGRSSVWRSVEPRSSFVVVHPPDYAKDLGNE